MNFWLIEMHTCLHKNYFLTNLNKTNGKNIKDEEKSSFKN